MCGWKAIRIDRRAVAPGGTVDVSRCLLAHGKHAVAGIESIGEATTLMIVLLLKACAGIFAIRLAYHAKGGTHTGGRVSHGIVLSSRRREMAAMHWGG